jgi:uncharacterized protein YcaQ
MPMSGRGELSIEEARRVALDAQGFGTARPRRSDVRTLRRAVDRMGLLQIDSVNVVVRSHYMPLFSRAGPYRMGSLDDLAYRRRELFEYWGHVASLLPIRHYPLFRHRMDAAHTGKHIERLRREEPKYVQGVLDEVRERGPLTAGDLEDPGKRTGPWWGRGKGKIALEALFGTGVLTVRERRNFARVYDLTERVIPEDVLARPAPSREEAHRELLRLSARSHGIGTARDLADYYRIPVPEARARLAELVQEGDVHEVKIEGWTEPAFVHPESRLPGRIDARALLTPFDPIVWERDRTERIFGFRYRIEIYVPEPRREYGYYVMPFLLGDRLVARVDLKSERQERELLVRGAWIEDGSKPRTVAGKLAEELGTMAAWLGLERVRVGRRGNLARELRSAVTPPAAASGVRPRG